MPQSAQDRLLAAAICAARDEERERIARELHDSIGSDLTALHLLLFQLQEGSANPQHAATFVQIQQLLQDSRHKLHAILHDLQAPQLQAGLLSAMRDLCLHWQQISGIHCQLILQNIEDEQEFHAKLPPQMAQTLYRICEEGLQNVVRHAKANTVHIFLCLNRGPVNKLELKIADNGHAGRGKPGRGLRGIAERVAALDGTLEQHYANGHTLSVQFPLASIL